MGNFRTVFVGDYYFDVLSNSNPLRNYVDTFHQYSVLNEIKMFMYALPRTGIATSSIAFLGHDLNYPEPIYIIYPALSDH